MRSDTIPILLPLGCTIQEAQVMIRDLQRTFYQEYDFDGFKVKHERVYAILKVSQEGFK